MALALTEAILAENGEFNPKTVWGHFVAWSKQASDIGITTSASLRGSDYRTASKLAHEMLGRTDSNGSLMRIAPIGIAGVRWGREKTVQIAREQSDLTHYESITGWSSAVAAEIIRHLILGGTLESGIESMLQLIDSEHQAIFADITSDGWYPADRSDCRNAKAIFCLAQALWAVRTTSSFEEAVVAAINLGDDADTVAAVTGAIAGAMYGIQQIPARWVTYVHGHVRQPDGSDRVYHQHEIIEVAHQLIGVPSRPLTAPETIIPPMQVHDVGIYASNLLGAQTVGDEIGIISLCRMEDRLHHHAVRREFYIIDESAQGHNPYLSSVTEDAVNAIEAFLREGREVLVHCHGGRSRTGFILKAWYMRRFTGDHFEAEEWLEMNWPHYAVWNTDFFDFLSNEWGK
jgi:ADP-ribosyl-[dinitrogen reductase] hydrolase